MPWNWRRFFCFVNQHGPPFCGGKNSVLQNVVLVHEVKGKPYNFEGYLCGFSTFETSFQPYSFSAQIAQFRARCPFQWLWCFHWLYNVGVVVECKVHRYPGSHHHGGISLQENEQRLQDVAQTLVHCEEWPACISEENERRDKYRSRGPETL